MISEKKFLLRQDILEGFPKVVLTRNQKITCGETKEEAQISRDFEGRAWWLIPIDVLRTNYGSMAFFTPEAYHYFLPSYMCASLDEFDANNEILMFTVFSLAPTKTDKDDKRYSQRILQFTAPQRKLIQRFLSLVIDAPFYSLTRDAERGLRKFWG